jgi:hypothetical protein
MFDSYYRFPIIERTLESAVDGGVTVTTGNCFGPPLVRPRLKRRTENTVRSIRDTFVDELQLQATLASYL